MIGHPSKGLEIVIRPLKTDNYRTVGYATMVLGHQKDRKKCHFILNIPMVLVYFCK